MYRCGEQVLSIVEKVVELFGPSAQNRIIDQVLPKIKDKGSKKIPRKNVAV
jgi:hypothetical protein